MSQAASRPVELNNGFILLAAFLFANYIFFATGCEGGASMRTEIAVDFAAWTALRLSLVRNKVHTT